MYKGILDESECPQTFGRLPEMVQDIIAGSEIAVADKLECSGNDLNAGETAMQKKKSISGIVRLVFRPTCGTAVTKNQCCRNEKKSFWTELLLSR